MTKLQNPTVGWKLVGKVPPAERVERFKSFDPIVGKDQVPTREKRRFRDIQLPDDLEDWFKPEHDDGQWNSGLAPVGTGL